MWLCWQILAEEKECSITHVLYEGEEGHSCRFDSFWCHWCFKGFCPSSLTFSHLEKKMHLRADLGTFKKTLFKMRWNLVFQIRINTASSLKSSSDGLEREREI